MTVNFPRTVAFRTTGKTIRTDDRTLLKHTDGDTVDIQQPVRMVSVDTPEKSGYAGSPAVSQPKLDRCRERLAAGLFPDIPDALSEYLVAKLTPDAAKRHIDAASQASAELEAALEVRLSLPDDKRRKLAVMPTGAYLDENARLLAYYPSLPGNDDLNRAIEAARIAWETPFGARAEFGEDLLLAYEYRACIKLAADPADPDPAELTAAAFRRHCVDLRDLSLRGRFDWSDVPGWARLWIWDEDLEQARVDLGLSG